MDVTQADIDARADRFARPRVGLRRVRHTTAPASALTDPEGLCRRIAEECPDTPSWDDMTIMVIARR